MLLIKNGTVLDPYTLKNEASDILIDDNGVILEIAKAIQNSEADLYDASGCTVSPGLVDVHVHFRDPGFTYKEDLQSGSAAAAAGGFTTVVCMANTKPVLDSTELVYDVCKRAKTLPINVLQAAAVTAGLKGEALCDFAALKQAGAVGFTDDGINLSGAGLCREAMLLAKSLDMPLSFHEEDPSLVLFAGVNFGSAAAEKLGVSGAMAEAEETMIARDIALAVRTGARVCFQHVSSALSVELIRQGKKLGADIHAEVTPHHISMTEDDVLTFGTNAKMNPPLRCEADRRALIAGICDGTLDMIATDHAPHAEAEKAKPFSAAPSGIIGLETSFSVCNTYLVREGFLTPMALLRVMSQNPAAFYKLNHKAIAVGNKAELMIADWNETVSYQSFKSKADNSPFKARPLYGKVKCVVMGNKVI